MLSHNLDLIVYYYSGESSGRKWDLWPRNYNYRYKTLPGIPFKTSIGDQNLNLSIINELILNKPHVLILEDYTSPTTWFALAIAKLLKIPLIYWTEGIKEPQSILGKISRPLRTLFIKKSDSIVVPGRVSKRYVISLGADPEKVFIAPNAIDNELFIKISNEYQEYKDQIKAELGLEKKVVLLYVGRIVEEKGIIFLLDAYKKLKSENSAIALMIIGCGELRNKLQGMCEAERISDVLFVGAITDCEELVRYYNVSDIFVLPTLEDVWGFVLNEAMICGLPTVSTYASQAAQEMIRQGENGYIVREADAEELYRALKELVCNTDLREKMGLQSKEIALNEFSVKHMARAFLQTIDCVLAQKTNGSAEINVPARLYPVIKNKGGFDLK
jgi:glycosyltransferase involved in cell wall biosynthesis